MLIAMQEWDKREVGALAGGGRSDGRVATFHQDRF